MCRYDEGLTDAMARLARMVADNRQTVEDLFRRLDVNKNNRLEPPELMKLFDLLLPGMTHQAGVRPVT